MDYIPPERPALIAQAGDEESRDIYKMCFTGQIYCMDLFDDFDAIYASEDWDKVRKHGLKPGQYFPLCKAEDNQLTFYVQEHKPCSAAAFAAFIAISKTKMDTITNPHCFVPEKQLGLISEILGDKLDKSKYASAEVTFDILSVGRDCGKNRRGLVVTTMTRQKPQTLGRACYLVSDPRNRVIEEVGYKGCPKDSKYWYGEADKMFFSARFVREKENGEAGKNPLSR